MNNPHSTGGHSHDWRKFHSMPDTERRQWQDPEKILGHIGLKAGDTFVDVGCGRGFFALPAARIVGISGKVFGVDIDAVAIDELKKAAESEKLQNMVLVAAEAESTVFCRSCADIIFFGIDLHDFRDSLQVLRNACTMLGIRGKIVDLDWNKHPSPFGPPLEIRFDEKKAGSLLESAGLKVQSVSPYGPYHYLVIASL